MIHLIDSPSSEELIHAINQWQQPPWPEKWKKVFPVEREVTVWHSGDAFRNELSRSHDLRSRARLEKLVIEWLYDFIRLNVKRGRIFDLREVLLTRKADCLGYAKLLSALGIHWGLDLGVVEVIIDNRGQIMPHTDALVKLSNGSLQWVDFWYGCRNIRHQRLGLNIKHESGWQIEDIDFKDIRKFEDVSYLPDYCVDAITFYIQGNRFLKQDNYPLALEKYNQSIQLYPGNARVYYNRAIAYERLGQKESARADYARALQDDSSLTRTLATQPAEVVDLIRLDEENIPDTEQQVYLRQRGFHKGCLQTRVLNL